MVSWKFYMTDHALGSTPMNKMAVHILITFIVYQSGWVHGTFLTQVRSTTFHSSFPPPFGNTSLQYKVTWCAVGTTAMDTSCCIHCCYYLAWRPTVAYHTHTGLWYGGWTEFYKSVHADFNYVWVRKQACSSLSGEMTGYLKRSSGFMLSAVVQPWQCSQNLHCYTLYLRAVRYTKFFLTSFCPGVRLVMVITTYIVAANVFIFQNTAGVLQNPCNAVLDIQVL